MGSLLLVSRADTLSMSPYSSVVAHTCACILWAFGKPHGLLVGLVLSSSSEPSLTLSTDSPLNTWATHCLRDVLRMGNVRLLTWRNFGYMQCSVSWKGATFSHIWEGARQRVQVGAAGYTHNMAPRGYCVFKVEGLTRSLRRSEHPVGTTTAHPFIRRFV
jgi:hypothetical protein